MGSEEGKSDNSDEDYDGYKLSYYEGRNLNNLEQMEECLQRSMRAKFKVLKCFLVAILSSISLLMILFTVLLYFELSSNRNSGVFIKVFSHDTAGGMFSSQEDALSKNPNTTGALLFSILDQLEDFRNDDGSFHFKLCYPELAGVGGGRCNEWLQDSNPATETDIAGFRPISLSFTRN